MKTVSLILVAFVAAAVLGAPAPRSHGPTPFGPRIRPVYTTNPTPLIESNTLASSDPIAIAQLYTSLATDGLPLDSIRVSSSHTNKRNGVTHVYLQQVLHGLDILNAVANVNVNEGHKVVSFGQSFFKHSAIVPAPVASFKTKLSPQDAIAKFAKFLNRDSSATSSALQMTTRDASTTKFSVTGAPFASRPIQADLKYIQTQAGAGVRLVWQLLVELTDSDHFYDASVDAETGEVLSLFDMVSDLSTYNVYPFGINDPDSGDRQLIDDPAHPVASPFGWHSQGILGRNFTDTQGNNVRAQSNHAASDQYRPDGGPALNFDFPVNLTQHPHEYEDAAVTNLFYWSNVIHDFYYAYGFDEESGNFQTNNFGRGGAGNDPVETHAQDGGGTDNANFLTLPDGQEGIMRMYLWVASPYRDGDLDGGIVVHEYSHGLSIRLTGGPANVRCLDAGEGGGMGEGWGDIIATVTRTTAQSTRAEDYAMGAYAASDSAGIRYYVYSTNLTTNPSTYGFLSQSAYWGVHAKGEVWAVILYEVFWNLVDEYGFESNWFNNRSPAGNTVFMQLLLDGMKFQPCDPTFVDARDAILQADELDYAGWHKCAIWKGFAKRGVGFSAVGGTGEWWENWNGEEAFDLPTDCL